MGEELGEGEEESDVKNDFWVSSIPSGPLGPHKCTMKNEIKYMLQYKPSYSRDK